MDNEADDTGTWTEVGKEESSKKRRRETKTSSALRLSAHRVHLTALLAYELRCHERCCDATLEALVVSRLPFVLCNVAVDNWQADAPSIETVRVITECQRLVVVSCRLVDDL